MSGETTTSTATGWLQASNLTVNSAPYAIDPNPAMLHIRTEMMGPGSKVKAFSKETKDTALSGNITEATGLSNTAWDTAQVTATAAEWGIMRQLTKFAERTNVYGPEGLQYRMQTDGVAMCLERWEALIWAEWANASTTVGTSGAAMTLADIGSAFAQHTINKSNGQIVFMLTATQSKNVRNEALSSGAAFLANGSGAGILRQTQPGGYVGNILGADLFTNNLGTASGANTLGCAMIDAAAPGADPVNGATAAAVVWMPESFMIGNAAMSGGAQIAVTMCAGLVEVLDFAYVKIATIT
jgi:hypothetical protein